MQTQNFAMHFYMKAAAPGHREKYTSASNHHSSCRYWVIGHHAAYISAHFSFVDLFSFFFITVFSMHDIDMQYRHSAIMMSWKKQSEDTPRPQRLLHTAYPVPLTVFNSQRIYNSRCKNSCVFFVICYLRPAIVVRASDIILYVQYIYAWEATRKKEHIEAKAEIHWKGISILLVLFGWLSSIWKFYQCLWWIKFMKCQTKIK